MPNSRNRRRVRLVWPFRAAALRRWARSIFAEVRSSNSFGGDRFNHQNGINAATAVWIWHSVNSRFFRVYSEETGLGSEHFATVERISW